MKQPPLFLAYLLLLLPMVWVVIMTANTTFLFDTEAAKNVAKTSWQLSFGERKWWYELINLATIIFPFLLSFDKRVWFYGQWKYALPAILITAAFFVVWDIYFTWLGVWGFNERYIGTTIAGLPLGEWLFFFTVPYACIFVYECLRAYFSDWGLQKIEPYITPVVIIILWIFGLLNPFKTYTAWAFLLAAALLTFHYFFLPNTYRGRFYQAYIICLIPFLLVNGVLTGAFNEQPVVLYNDSHNLAAVFHSRLVTIPWDDLAYCMLLLLMNITIFEWFRSRK